MKNKLPKTPYEAAQQRVKSRKGFYRHFSSYAIVGIFFMVLNTLTYDGELWFFFPMIAWGVGLAFHYVGVFGIPFIGALDEAWELKEIERELQKMGKNTHTTPLELPTSETLHEIDAFELDTRPKTERETFFEDDDLEEIKERFGRK
jgi:hypothetical protein